MVNLLKNKFIVLFFVLICVCFFPSNVFASCDIKFCETSANGEKTSHLTADLPHMDENSQYKHALENTYLSIFYHSGVDNYNIFLVYEYKTNENISHTGSGWYWVYYNFFFRWNNETNTWDIWNGDDGSIKSWNVTADNVRLWGYSLCYGVV